MECPHCHAANPDASSVCTHCTTRFSIGEPGAGGPDTSPPTTGAAGQPGGPNDQLSQALKSARLVGGKYEIALELGRGGMGVVYNLRHPRSGRRRRPAVHRDGVRGGRVAPPAD